VFGDLEAGVACTRWLSRWCSDAGVGACRFQRVGDGRDNAPVDWIWLDGCRLYLSSDIAGSNDVDVATRGM
jgi:hypothetical protein